MLRLLVTQLERHATDKLKEAVLPWGKAGACIMHLRHRAMKYKGGGDGCTIPW